MSGKYKINLLFLLVLLVMAVLAIISTWLA
jgi:hypothetical protein